jgi:hypothetical protein
MGYDAFIEIDFLSHMKIVCDHNQKLSGDGRDRSNFQSITLFSGKVL